MKRWIHASTAWIDKEALYENEEFDIMGEEFENFWQEYLGGPETAINDKLNIFVEPSVRGESGAVFIFDESGEDRFETVSVDWYDWCDTEFNLALKANSAEEYATLYEKWVRKLCGI